MLNDHCSGPNAPAGNQIADTDTDEIAASQLAVDRQVEERAIAKPMILIEQKPNGPNLFRF
jgi:hypothetical protein